MHLSDSPDFIPKPPFLAGEWRHGICQRVKGSKDTTDQHTDEALLNALRDCIGWGDAIKVKNFVSFQPGFRIGDHGHILNADLSPARTPFDQTIHEQGFADLKVLP
jgi:hypothetical protein